MKDVKQSSCLVFDHGLFLPLAQKLAESFDRVYYHSPFEESFPKFAKGCLGDGYQNVIRCNDIWKVKKDVDVWCFPDIQHSGLQLELESQGCAVWGSRNTDSYEVNREKFLRCLGDIGLPVPTFERVIGLSALRDELLKSDGEKFIKISRWRGDMETWRHVTIEQSQSKLDELASRFGPAQEEIPFLVFDPIDAVVEVGFDGYSIDGAFPTLAIHGIEVKDSAYIGTFQKYDDLPDSVKEVNEKFAPILASCRYRNFYSSEIRVTKSDEFFFIDPCLRCPSPSTEAQLELYGNLAEIIAAGAHGELVDPEPAFEFAVEAVLSTTASREKWNVMDIPEKVRRWVKVENSCEINGLICVPPDRDASDDLGWVVGVGNTIDGAIEHVKKTAEALGDCPVSVNVRALIDALEAVEKEESAGIEFTKDSVPSPEVVIAD